jgi:hypothetical protein
MLGLVDVLAHSKHNRQPSNQKNENPQENDF